MEEQKNKISKKGIVLGIAGLVVLFSVGYLVLGAWSPFITKEDKVVSRMIDKMAEVKNHETEGTLNLRAVNQEGEEFSLVYNFSGKNDHERNASEMSFDFIANFIGEDFSGSGEMIQMDNESFLKLTSFSEREILFFNVSQLMNRWFRFGIDDLEMEELSREDKKVLEEIKKSVKKHDIFYVKETLPDVTEGGNDFYHHVLSVDRKELKKMIVEVADIMSDPLKESDIEDLEKFLNNLGEIEIETYIGKRDNLLYKIRAEKEFNLSDLSDDPFISDVTVKVNLEVNLFNFNQGVEIDIPDDFEDFDKVVDEMTQGFFPFMPISPGINDMDDDFLQMMDEGLFY